LQLWGCALSLIFPLNAAVAQQPTITSSGDAAESGPFPLPDVDAGVLALLSQDYLTDEERLLISLRHGIWEDADLVSPSDRALAAATVGRWNDPAFTDETVPVELRAAAFVARGEPERAEHLLRGTGSSRGVLLLAKALIAQGRPDEANLTLVPLVIRLLNEPVNDADELVDLVEAAALQAALAEPADAASNPKRWVAELARARGELDPFSWAAPLAEANLLLEHHNYAEAGPAFQQALERNPREARIWALFGTLSVNSFDLEKAERIAKRLDELAVPAPSIDAAIVRASANMRRGAWAEAAAALELAMAEYPASRELLAARAGAVAGTFDVSKVEEALAAFERLAPGSPEALLAVGDAFAEARQYEEAREYLTRAAQRSPRRASAHAALGLSELQAGRLESARDALTRAAELDGANNRVANSLMLLDELASYRSVASEHFEVRYKPSDPNDPASGADALVAREMLPELERIFVRVTGAEKGGIDHQPPGKTVVELYPNHRWFGVRITGMPGIHTIAAATGPVIAMEAPREGAGHMGPYDWARVVQHEFTHTVTLSRTKNRLPHWFTEAGAVYLEDGPRDYSTVQLLTGAFDSDSLFDFSTINIAFVRPKNPAERPLAYAQGHWMYEYIIEKYGPRAPLELMDWYAAGVSEADAFARVLKTTREEFLAGFKDYARDQLVAWGMKLPEGAPPLSELLEGENVDDAADLDDEALARLLESYPAHVELLRLAAQRAVPDNGRGGPIADDALGKLEAYAAARPVDPWPRRMLAQYALLPRNAGTAHARLIPHLEFLDAREQHSPAWAMELARRYAAVGEFEKSREKALRATRISPYDARPRELAATLALRRADQAGALEQLKALTIIEPDREIHRRRLEALENQK